MENENKELYKFGSNKIKELNIDLWNKINSVLLDIPFKEKFYLIENLLIKIRQLENQIIEKDNKINKLYTMIGELVGEKDEELKMKVAALQVQAQAGLTDSTPLELLDNDNISQESSDSEEARTEYKKQVYNDMFSSNQNVKNKGLYFHNRVQRNN